MAEDIKNTEATEVPNGNFIHTFIEEDIAEGGRFEGKKVHTRFPPEPNGYLHIGHAKAICIDFGTAEKFGGICNLRMDDTNPTKEDVEYVDAIKEDIKWLGFDWEDRFYFASEYFDQMYDYAVELIKKGLAYVCELTPEQMRENRGDTQTPAKSPYRDRPIEESLDLFARMKAGEFEDGKMTLRAKIDLASGNFNMRDPVLYRISHMHHHRTGDQWCIYPMYDYAHPIEDALEGITHSLCSLEFEAHRPLYDWVIEHSELPCKPRQIEFARLNINHTVMSKRKLRLLVENGVVDGWDDPRMPTLCGLRRRGYTPKSIRSFTEQIGVSKVNSIVEYSFLEHCLREDLNETAQRTMAVLRPVKLIITNYPEDKTETFEVENNPNRPEDGTRTVTFSRELFIEQDDFMEEPPKKYFRLFPGNEVRLMNAYFVTCTGYDVDEDGNVYYMTEHENFGKMIEFLSKCQQEGLLDPDWAVNTSSTVQEKLAGGKAIIAQINRNGLGETTPTMLETLGLTYDDLGYIGALKGSDGTCKYMRTEAINFVTVILRGSENAADAVNWINLKQQNQLYINIGVEGTHFNYDEDGGIAPINPIFAEERGNSYWYIDSTNEEEFATEWPSRVRKSDAQWAGFEAVTLYANENTPEIFVNNDFAFKPATENYAKYNTALFSSMNDYILQILAGSKTLDDLPTFQADWKNAGGDAVQAELQAWYDSFYG